MTTVSTARKQQITAAFDSIEFVDDYNYVREQLKPELTDEELRWLDGSGLIVQILGVDSDKRTGYAIADITGVTKS